MSGLQRLFWGLVVIAIALSGGLATAQSLAEVAKKEKKRRQTNTEGSSKVITDRELTRSYGGLPTATSSVSTGQSTDEDAEGEDQDGQGEGEQQDETQSQEYWQGRVQAAKDKIAGLEERLNGENWGDGQMVGVDPRGQRNLAQREETEKQLEAARKELEAIRAEARRANVPPGWVR